MINKLLLVRIAFVKADMLDRAKLSQLVVGDPIKVLPLSWSEEDKPSHYAYTFKNLSLESRDALVKFDIETDGTSLLDLSENQSIEGLLYSHGLRVHPLV